ncbi:tripartite tricarboxylate transporter permease [Bosea sp. TAF32]|uniref:tripartite tricarboxylate transporter permease n=1 Tax=Bosea sp. TAF32 TaxID=3237482 RepID=UPI003F912AAE
MEIFDNLALGLSVAFTPMNLLFCFVGVLIGTLIGVLPGIGPVATMAMLLPITFYLTPTAALIMLAGIYYGAQYGGSTTAILINTPGESTSVVTCLDGHAMARRGRAGAALAVAAIGSFFAGTVSTLLIALASPPLTRVALQFGPAEYFSLMVLGLVGAVVLAQGSLLKALAMTCLGLLLGLVGTDLNTGDLRYTFDIPELIDGIGFMPIAMGLFGMFEIISNLEHRHDRSASRVIGSLMPSRDEMRASIMPILRGTGIGAILGVLPGGGALLSSFAAYAIEKKIAKDPSRFGHGAIEGVASPESANNAGAQTSFIPMLTLGIPSNPVMAMMLGALMIQGVAPGPSVMTQQPSLFWGVIASMWVGNLMLVVINLPLVGIWVRLLTVPYRFLFPCILFFCVIGVYTVNNSAFEVVLAAIFATLGYVFFKVGCEPAPMLLGFILGPMMEENLRRAMILSHGDPTVFTTEPISLGLLIVSAALLAAVVLPALRRTREEAFKEA